MGGLNYLLSCESVNLAFMSNSPHEWYLRIEAVNLDHSVYDTNDISTIRGGSSLLLEAVKKITEKPEFRDRLIRVSVGASTGLYEVKVSTDAEMSALEARVREYLKSDPYCYFATFVVAATKWPLAEANDQLASACALQQYRLPTFAFSPYEDSPEECEECGYSGVRPAKHNLPGKKQKVSHAVYVRLEHGKRLRKELYQPCFVGKAPDIQIPYDLEELAQNDDIAVIHFDGNRFGAIRDHCKLKEDYQRLDEAIQGIQQQAICQIVKHSPKAGDKLRLETLLWGGDEIELVVPAPQVWATLQRFFEATATKPCKIAGKQFTLTWSAGVVFCRHNLPILQVRRYAEQLCSIAKRHLSDAPESFTANDNRFTYLNMSSFELISREVEPFIKSYHQPASVEDFTFTMQEIGQLHADMVTIICSFPKNKVYDIVELIQRGEAADSLVERALKMADSSSKAALDAAIKRVLGKRDKRWLLIGDLWNLVGGETL
jgi:hypothetical protein